MKFKIVMLILGIVMLALTISDMITTDIGLRNGARELCPITNYLGMELAAPLVTLNALMLAFFPYYFLSKCEKRFEPKMKEKLLMSGGLLILITITLFAVTWNLFTLQKMGLI